MEDGVTAAIWATKVAAAGDSVSTAILRTGWEQGATTNQFQKLWRAVSVANLNSLPFEGQIVGARLILNVETISSLNAKPSIVLTRCQPASYEELVASDYAMVDVVPFSNEIAFAGLAIDTDIVFEFNQDGIDYLNTQMGMASWAALAVRTLNDVNDVAPTWSTKLSSNTTYTFHTHEDGEAIGPRFYLEYEDGNFMMV
ncbi:MAG: hypothetical protein WC483_03835 [Candidatus Paceibacterota bacterium]